MLKKYLITLSNPKRYQILESLIHCNGVSIQDKNTFGGEIALLVNVSENNEEEFMQIIKEADRIVRKE
ncbi:MAG TPA: hypothetical protein VHT73_17030 [Thermodesulfobacteriota bacterium]|nr:hypothetical protein [Thermodesulfobacteriota bacterium]